MQHVIFCPSAAGVLRQTLAARDQNDKVTEFSASLDWGPLANDNFHLREKWFEQHAPAEPSMWDWLADHGNHFCDQLMADVDRLVWLSPRAAHEQAGLYWYLQKFGDDNTQILIADYVLGIGSSMTEAPFGLGELNMDAMGKLLDEAPRSTWDRTRFPPDRWSQLVADNALLRVVDHGQIQSVKDDYFDDILLNCCANEWTDWLRVMGKALCDASDAGHQISDRLLLWRMRVLTCRGILEADRELRFGSARERVKVRLTGMPKPSLAAKV